MQRSQSWSHVRQMRLSRVSTPGTCLPCEFPHASYVLGDSWEVLPQSSHGYIFSLVGALLWAVSLELLLKAFP